MRFCDLFEAERFRGTNRRGDPYDVLLDPSAAMLAYMVRRSGDQSVRVVADRQEAIAIADAERAVHIEMRRTLAEHGVDIDIASTAGDLWIIAAGHPHSDPQAPLYVVQRDKVGVYDSGGRPASPTRWPVGLRRLVRSVVAGYRLNYPPTGDSS